MPDDRGRGWGQDPEPEELSGRKRGRTQSDVTTPTRGKKGGSVRSSEDMRERKTTGRGWHGDRRAHQLAGQKGGQVTSSRYSEDHYKKIGRKGGKASAKSRRQRGSEE